MEIFYLFLTLLTVNASPHRQKRQAATDNGLLWPQGVVYYQFDDNDPNADNAAIGAIQPSGPCDSQVGMIGGVQIIHVGGTCNEMEALHEFIHALGFYHIHNRYDRNSFINVNKNNVISGDQLFFDKQATNQIVPYDMGSIMHYGVNAFANPSTYSLVPVDQRYFRTVGAVQPSFYDYQMVNTLYKCSSYCSGQPTPSCQNGGYQNPRSCATCICPDGYGGNLCNKKSSCSQTLTATSTWSSTTLTTASPQPQDYENPMKCSYFITAPPGTQIQVKFTSISGACEYGCPFNGFEVKLNQDVRFVEPRYCCKDQVTGDILQSGANPTVIMTYQVKMYSATANIQYRYVPSGGTYQLPSDTQS